MCMYFYNIITIIINMYNNDGIRIVRRRKNNIL